MNVSQGRRGKLRAMLLVLLMSLTAFVAAAPPAAAATPNNKKIDTDSVQNLGWDSSVRAYHFRVYGRWTPNCGGKYCYTTELGRMGSYDAVSMFFNGPMTLKKMRIRIFDACYKTMYDKTSGALNTGFFDASAAVNDSVFEGYRVTKVNGQTHSSGTCKQNEEPQKTHCAVGGGGGGCITQWFDMAAVNYAFEVWGVPNPTSGSCYDHLTVKAAYRHTWSSQGLSWSLGFPWSVGVGVSNVDHSWQYYQSADATKDADLRTGRVCRSGP